VKRTWTNPPPRVRRLLSLAAFGASCLVATAAQAQTVTFPGVPGTLGRIGSDGTTLTKRPQQNYPDGISLDDCNKDLRIQIPYTLSAIDPSTSLQVWAGTGSADCTVQTSRSGATRVCWVVSPRNLDLVLAGSMQLKVRDIIAQAKSTAAGESYVNAGADVCGTVDRQTFTIFVMLLRGQDVLGGQKLTVEADTIGPPALSNVKISAGDTRMVVNWSSIGEAGANDAQLVSIFYGPATGETSRTERVCEDASSSSTDSDAGDASTVADASCVDKVITSGSCTANGLTTNSDGSITVDESKLSRLNAGAVGSNAIVSGLNNGTTYAVAVGATDSFLNVGNVSEPQCVAPEILDDFFEVYRKAGGQAGGCSIPGGDAPAGSLTLMGSIVAIVVTMLRKQRKKAR